ncbi:MAG: hypothetical protein R2684_00955 [Pyrinomonadaceae bacterium]
MLLSFVNKFVRSLGDIGFLLMFSLIFGTAASLLLGFGFAFTRRHPIIALVVTGAFMVFHLNDIRRFWSGGNYLAFFLRPIVVALIGLPVAGIVSFAISQQMDYYDRLFLFSCVPCLAGLMFFALFVRRFFSSSSLLRSINGILIGMSDREIIFF